MFSLMIVEEVLAAWCMLTCGGWVPPEEEAAAEGDAARA
jgi:hypothetical protein